MTRKDSAALSLLIPRRCTDAVAGNPRGACCGPGEHFRPLAALGKPLDARAAPLRLLSIESAAMTAGNLRMVLP
jgi:hypothetical protein